MFMLILRCLFCYRQRAYITNTPSTSGQGGGSGSGRMKKGSNHGPCHGMVGEAEKRTYCLVDVSYIDKARRAAVLDLSCCHEFCRSTCPLSGLEDAADGREMLILLPLAA